MRSRAAILDTSCVREAFWAAGKAIQPFGFVREASGASISRRGPFFRAGTEIKSPGQEKQGCGRLKLEPGWPRGRFSRWIKPAWSILPPWARALEGIGG